MGVIFLWPWSRQGKRDCPLPLQPHPQNQPGPLGEGTTLKPDISLATKSGHFNLLRTLANNAGLIGGSRRATEVWVHGNFPLLKQPLRYVAPVLIPLAPIP